MTIESQLRQLPAVDQLLRSDAAVELARGYGHDLLVEALRAALAGRRQAILEERAGVPEAATILQEARLWLESLTASTLQPVINATGVIIHTNLGRAPLSTNALAAVAAAAAGYSNLEYDLELGRRGARFAHAEAQLTRLTGSEAALVVNNNAAAVLLALTALTAGREVIISRGQLVEIGGGFRMPDVMAQSGARLVEVGATNRTHLRDYERAISDHTAAILVAHHSNFKIVGFTTEPALSELAQLSRRHQLPLLYDQGSGALLDTTPYGLAAEPTVQEALAAGVDLVTFSGDKLLGGPQAGLICGRAVLVERLKRHPLTRAVRPDKLCLAALSATLVHYLAGRAHEEIPVWQMIARSVTEIGAQAEKWAGRLRERGLPAVVIEGESTVGGGSLPGTTLPTRLAAIDHPHPERIAALLRAADPPLIGRVREGRLLLDPRTVLADQAELALDLLSRLDLSGVNGT